MNRSAEATKLDPPQLEQRYTVLLEMGHDAILILDDEDCVQTANARAAEISGYLPEELIGLPLRLLLDEEGHRFFLEMKAQAARPPRSDLRLCADLPLVTREGGARDVEACFAVLQSEREDRPAAVYLFIRDLTERIRIQKAFREANTFLRNIINSSVDGIIAADRQGNIIIFNEGAQRILGYGADEVVGKMHITQIYPEGLAKEIMRRLRSDDYGGPDKMATTRFLAIDKQGRQFPFDLSAALIRDEAGREVASVGIFTDIRERLRMERELEDTHLQLFQAEKMASLGKLAAGVAHEINNPLSGVLIHAQMLSEELAPDHARQGDLQLIVEQTLRVKDILKNLLEFARPTGEAMTGISLGANIDQAIKIIANQAAFHDIEIVRDYDPDLPPIIGDTSQLNQVFINLLVNAADAIEGPGRITITTATQGDHVRVQVIDTGSGVSPQHQPKLFDPFFTTKPAGKGTGLGLSTSYGIIKRHGGQISVESEPGQGTTFVIELPTEPPPAVKRAFEQARGQDDEELIG
ncbi:MAG: PAS domain S-box protein [Proteobacteria bacterium]|nr:PAS domain S-box protein [Pseudomonadota bacterium]